MLLDAVCGVINALRCTFVYLKRKFRAQRGTMSRELGEKIKAIREAEGLTQSGFSEVTGISLSTIKKYETGVRDPGGSTLVKITTHNLFKKYTMWLMSDETNEAAGQISPALSPNGQNSTSDHQNGKKAG